MSISSHKLDILKLFLTVFEIIIMFLLSSVQILSYPPSCSLIHDLFFFINWYYICTHIHMHIYLGTLLGLYSVTCMYMFMSDHLLWNNSLVCSAQGKTFAWSQHSLVAQRFGVGSRLHRLPHFRLVCCHLCSAHILAVILERLYSSF